jgi:hypothetical protein
LVNKTRRLLHVDNFFQLTIKKGVYIKLSNGPAMREGKG